MYMYVICDYFLGFFYWKVYLGSVWNHNIFDYFIYHFLAILEFDQLLDNYYFPLYNIK